MKNIVIFFFLFLFIMTTQIYAGDCDKASAQHTFDLLVHGAGAKLDDHGVTLHVDLDAWTELDTTKKQKMLRAIADTDACIQGKARAIFIYAWGEKVAEASPIFGFKVIK